jgi:threonylcarbamoyladenosine tRNA methylthiotransferase MtaB
MSLSLPGVSLIIGNDEKQNLLDYLNQETDSGHIAVSKNPQSTSVCLQPLTSFSGRSRAFVQIQNGCDAFCSYCIIPYARGASRSASFADILQQITTLVDAGFKEVVLTGIHIGNYGKDLVPDSTLAQLIKRIECETELHRLRLGSIEPNEFCEDLLETISSSKIVCPHFHIPLQAGDDSVLHRMGRCYNTGFFQDLIMTLSHKVSNPNICLDVIAGFPAETDLEFKNTFDFISELPIAGLHVFPYSKRPGTPAAKMADQVPEPRKKIRAKKLRELAAQKRADYAKLHIGKNLEIIVQSNKKTGLVKGVSRNYLAVHFSSPDPLSGQCVTVNITEWKNGILVGKGL